MKAWQSLAAAVSYFLFMHDKMGVQRSSWEEESEADKGIRRMFQQLSEQQEQRGISMC